MKEPTVNVLWLLVGFVASGIWFSEGVPEFDCTADDQVSLCVPCVRVVRVENTASVITREQREFLGTYVNR